MSTYPYVTVDVFTEQRFGGNQLAVVTDARGLDVATMQAIAAEFGYAETTFVFPPKDPANTAQVRIFTPMLELGFAGHPNVGTAFVLARAGTVFGKTVGAKLIFEEAAGLVPMTLDATTATLTAPQSLQVIAEPVAADSVAAAIGLNASDVTTASHAPTIASVGTAFLLVQVVDVAAVTRCKPDTVRLLALPAAARGVLVYARQGASDICCRMFGAASGVAEDAATGSANVALAAYLASLDPNASADLVLDIRQGIEMGRPSRLLATATKRQGRVVAARIGGGCVIVMEGRITLA